MEEKTMNEAATEQETPLEEVQITAEEQVSFGKFKNAEALLEAYQNLEKEFTRRSQRLARLESDSAVPTDETPPLSEEQPQENAPIESVVAEQENAPDVTADSGDGAEPLPVYARGDWKQKVNAFYEAYPESKRLSGEIAQLLLNDRALATDENGLMNAYLSVLTNNYREQSELVEDNTFLDRYLGANPQVKQKIVDEYLLSLQRDKAPSTIRSGGVQTFSAARAPKSLTEAGKLLIDNLKK